jgi:hypothetical protein
MKSLYVNGWTEKELDSLVQIMKDGIKAGHTVGEALDMASDYLGRSRKATMNRWYAIRSEHLHELR